MCVYNFDDFIEACKRRDVLVWEHVPDCAFSDFGLWDEEQLLDFISSEDGVRTRSFQNSRLWEGNPEPSKPIMIDAYRFSSLEKIGYIAFFYNPKTKKWALKSFKRSKEIDGTCSETL